MNRSNSTYLSSVGGLNIRLVLTLSFVVQNLYNIICVVQSSLLDLLEWSPEEISYCNLFLHSFNISIFNTVYISVYLYWWKFNAMLHFPHHSFQGSMSPSDDALRRLITDYGNINFDDISHHSEKYTSLTMLRTLIGQHWLVHNEKLVISVIIMSNLTTMRRHFPTLLSLE